MKIKGQSYLNTNDLPTTFLWTAEFSVIRGTVMRSPLEGLGLHREADAAPNKITYFDKVDYTNFLHICGTSHENTGHQLPKLHNGLGISLWIKNKKKK